MVSNLSRSLPVLLVLGRAFTLPSGDSDHAIQKIRQATGLSSYGVWDHRSEPAQGLQCAGTSTTNFISRDRLNDLIREFCVIAGNQKVHDKDSGSINRIYYEYRKKLVQYSYNTTTEIRKEVSLGINFPQDLDISDNLEANCKDAMTLIMDSCDGNDPNNPLNWKHGGTFTKDTVQYTIDPFDQGYQPGQCWLHLEHDQDYNSGQFSTSNSFSKFAVKDSAGKSLRPLVSSGGAGEGPHSFLDDKNLVVLQSTLPYFINWTLSGAESLDFGFDAQVCSMYRTNDVPRCGVGGWTTGIQPRNHQMDCTFSC